MRTSKGTLLLVCMTMLAAVVLPSAKASESDQKIIETFSQSVQIPGRILPAGTYVFKLLDTTGGDHNIVQVFSKDEKHLYTTILAISEERFRLTDNPEIRLEERPAGGPRAIQSWFYPGRETGMRFVYPKARALEVGKQTNQQVSSMSSALAPEIMEPMESEVMPDLASMKDATAKSDSKEVE